MSKQSQYNVNKSAKVNSQIVCPVCGKSFIKKSYQQAFCCGYCKDTYHNRRRTDNGYFRRYNIEHPERLDRVGINIESDLEICLGDCECESMAQITMCPDAAQFEDLF